MKQRAAQRIHGLDIHVIPWVAKWDALAAVWLIESEPGREVNDTNLALALSWFRSMKDQRQNTVYAITSAGEPVGIVGVLNQNPIARTAELHLSLDKSVQGKGIGRVVGRSTIKTLFERGFERLDVAPASSNHEAVNIAIRLGFEKSDRVIPMELTRATWLASENPAPARHEAGVEQCHSSQV